jgi:DNA-binding CsgD family transcriptional regulator
MTRVATAAFGRAVATVADVQTLSDLASAHLQQVVGCGPVFLAAADPLTLHFVRESRYDISDEVAARFFAHEIGVPDVVKFRSLADARHPVGTLYRATDRAPHTSARWREVIEPLGWGDELRAAIRDGGRTWGFLCLHRVSSEPPFDDSDVDVVRTISQQVAAAFSRLALSAATTHTDAVLPPGVVVLDRQLVVTSMTETASEWFACLDGTRIGAPIALMSVAAVALHSGEPQSAAVMTLDRSWLSVHASPLQGAGSEAVVVVVQSAHPDDALPALAVSARLTPRESEVAAAAVRGLSDRAIARSLALSEYTVQDHLKRVYAKTGVRSRAELVARLLAR